jgi:hypothetical protein
VKKDDNPPQTQSSSPPTRPPKPPIVAAGTTDSGSENSGKPDYGCHYALSALAARYAESDINGAYSVLVEQEKLLRDHINFPTYKFQLGLTIASRSDIVSHLGDAKTAASIMEEAFSIMAEALRMPMATFRKTATPETMLKYIRERDAECNVKWRLSDSAA